MKAAVKAVKNSIASLSLLSGTPSVFGGLLHACVSSQLHAREGRRVRMEV